MAIQSRSFDDHRLTPGRLLPQSLAAVALAFALVACGGGGDDQVASPTTTEESPTNIDEPPTEGDVPEGGVTEDVDQDGVAEGDNCPFTFNPDQGDDDNDGIGNQCEDESLPVDPNRCGLLGSAAAEFAESGDASVVTICQPVTQVTGPPGWVVLGDVLVVESEYMIVDLQVQDLPKARDLGYEAVPAETAAGLDSVDLVELRIERDAAQAVATADPDLLAQISDDSLARLDGATLAAQSDRTLAALPDEFWVRVPEEDLSIVGNTRLKTINPDLLDTRGLVVTPASTTTITPGDDDG